MTTFTRELARAIETSVKEKRSVNITVYTESQLDDVICSADDYADEADGMMDVWGTDDYGEWRLTVAKRLYDDDACKSLLAEAEAARDWDLAQSCKVALGYVDGNAEFARVVVATAIDQARSNHVD